MADATLGSGGHAEAILKRIGPSGRLIGLDQDAEAISRCRERLKDFPQAVLIQENFRYIKKALHSLNISGIHAVILDVGFSSDQLEDPARGFSFERPGPLDMRMDTSAETTAEDLIRDLSQDELENIFKEFGEERWSAKFAQVICDAREAAPIQTTDELVEVLLSALPDWARAPKGKRPVWARRHPATKVFQALRIAVNDELGALKQGLEELWPLVEKKGRAAVISFHSMEDRIVKWTFRKWAAEKSGVLIIKKPVTAQPDEMSENPRSRSAKLRVIEKI